MEKDGNLTLYNVSKNNRNSKITPITIFFCPIKPFFFTKRLLYNP